MNEIYSNLNPILKKILLESNSNSMINVKYKSTNKENLIISHKSRVLIISDTNSEKKINYDQILLFKMKRQDINIDCISIGEEDKSIVP